MKKTNQSKNTKNQIDKILSNETLQNEPKINNAKLHEIRNTKAINWKKFAENANLNYTVLADVLSNRRNCTLRYAQRLIAPLAEYNIIVSVNEIIGSNTNKKKETKKN